MLATIWCSGREDQARRAVDRIDAGGENTHRTVTLNYEIDLRAFAAANPVALHGEDALGPSAFKLRDIPQQFVGISSGPQEPLFQRALLDRGRFVAPAAAIHHLLVRENGAADRAPVHQGLFAIGEAALHHAQEKPLVPAIVLGFAGGDFAVPVVRESKAPMRALHLFDVGERPVARRPIILDGGVFRGKPERVPAHGMQHVEAAHPHVAGKRVADRVVADVPNVKRAARIRQHLQHVEFRLGGVLLGFIKGLVFPSLVPLQLDLIVVVGLFGHFQARVSVSQTQPFQRVDVPLVVAFLIHRRFQNERLRLQRGMPENPAEPLLADVPLADIGVPVETRV